jgi:hypothetical protein
MDFASRNKWGQPGQSFPTFEHLIRRSDGGINDLQNVVLAHTVCNHWENILVQTPDKPDTRPKYYRKITTCPSVQDPLAHKGP